MGLFTDLDGDWNGTCGFRLMPSDALAVGASTASSSTESAGHGWLLRYMWTHPQDGTQDGTLLLGSPKEDGSIAAGWVDSWHQKPELRLLTGTASGGRASLAMEYDGWGWTIDVGAGGSGIDGATDVGAGADADTMTMVMCNVIPDGVEGAPPGSYVVMDAVWTRTQGHSAE